jgi:disulfide bond formation protein DsbB
MRPPPYPIALSPVAATGLLIMLAAIGTAWAFQLVGGYVPCALCLEQRVPYYLGIPLAVLALLLVRRVPLAGRLLLLGAAAAMLWAAGLGVYHAGVEWGFFEGPDACAGGGPVTSTADLMRDLEEKVFVSCGAASGRFLGLSFAGWNVVAASAAALTLLASLPLPARPRPA